MKMLSYNARGVGSKAKRLEVKELVSREKIDVVMIQETKVDCFNDLLCRGLVGTNNYSWAAKDAEGRSGGIATIWNTQVFSASTSWDFGGALCVKGTWLATDKECLLVNVYAPCPLAERILLWDRLSLTVEQWKEVCLCICGDFNSIRVESERVGRNMNPSRRDVELFDRFIRDADLLEYPLQSRKFTWYRGDGSCKSRIDRWFGNSNWMEAFPNQFLRGGKRGLSDHVPLLLETKVDIWGPKPFRSVNAWFDHPDFIAFVKDKWSGYKFDGWGGFVLKEKLKKLRYDVKTWNRTVFGKMENKICEHQEVIFKLDLLDDTFGLEEEEVIQRNRERALLIQDLKLRNNLLQQRAKLKWIKEGDVNSALFHRSINGRRRRNTIHGMSINNA